eukprot:TRINITY_DN3955_c0_g1_i1.p1 TRINITY_DN3955_c0_g1~~TRINITY_DN3955_c0_g1_i1.p1  ORF type:complete len:256 (+),score=42.38 TRINITY_DN3955_c0_g1_i1:161-928(+)
MLRSLVGSEMCIRDRYQRRVRGIGFLLPMLLVQPRDHMENQVYYNNGYDDSYALDPSYGHAPPMQRTPNTRQSYAPNSSQTSYSGKICTYWQKAGSCPNKRCPYAASHTARNSPRYAKYMKDTAPPPEPQPPVVRAHALEIKDPSPNSTPPSSRGTTPPLNPARPNALEIKDPERPNALEIKEPEVSKPFVLDVHEAPAEDSTPEPAADAPAKQNVTEVVVQPVVVATNEDAQLATASTPTEPRSRSRFANMFGK